ncbi:CPBP family intramembrane glutamic endopeptidase [Oceanirhabdus seepicola]|uniref:CPBP family intramembrane metalloprotease n=1 Tax=Oceanirhabdus seepicola TaxID=2828781 RepID=A0A9J6P6Y3_9CLOT|nr:CPBP family intramembrane glutamic endopeptidase [Oceanirhabdus seepicola]MCM1991264.1 CPBP family intramembrane metalloprotease [Oceanirhabdus seepicola]
MFNMAPALLYCKKIKRQNIIKVLRLNLISKKQLLYSTIIFVLYNIISAILIILQEDILELFNVSFVMEQPIAVNTFATIMFVLVGGFICPISEEFFFRGLLIRGMEKIGIKFGIFISAFYFAIYHNNPYRLITLLLFGVLIGYIVHYTNSILPGILFHILTNSIFVISTYILGPENYNKIYSNVSITRVNILENNYVLMIILVIVSLICFTCFKKLKSLSVPKESTLDSVDNKANIKGKIYIVTSVIFVTLLFIAIIR